MILERNSAPSDLRSHFLPTAPIIALFEEFPDRMPASTESRCAQLHEYLHFEQFVSWPVLVLNYYYNAYKMLRLCGVFRGDRCWDDETTVPSPWVDTGLSWSSRNWDPDSCARKQSNTFQLGIDALLEGDAILNFYLKPEQNELREQSVCELEGMFRDRPKNAHRPHVIGTEAILGAVGLGNQEFRDGSAAALYGLAGRLTREVMYGALAHVYRNLHVDPHRHSWIEVLILSQLHMDAIIPAYYRALSRCIELVFRGRSVAVSMACIRDGRFGRVCAHSLMLALYQRLWSIIRAKGSCHRYEAAIGFSLLYLLKYFEAIVQNALLSYKAQFMRPHWSPIPTFLFQEQIFTSLRFEPTGDSQTFRLQWLPSVSSQHQLISMFSWMRLSVADAVCRTLEHGESTVVCPYRKWVEDQYAKRGNLDETQVDSHLRKMCTHSLNLDGNGRSFDPAGLAPSADYCRQELASDAGSGAACCFFRSAVREIVFSPPRLMAFAPRRFADETDPVIGQALEQGVAYRIQLLWVDFMEEDWTRDPDSHEPRRIVMSVEAGGATVFRLVLGSVRGRHIFAGKQTTLTLRYDVGQTISLVFAEETGQSGGQEYRICDPWPFLQKRLPGGRSWIYFMQTEVAAERDST